MASVYILYSKKLSRFYTGSCLDLKVRLDQHLNQQFPGSYTAKANDWELFFEISNLNYGQARRVEKYIKSRKSSSFIRSLKESRRESLFALFGLSS